MMVDLFILTTKLSESFMVSAKLIKTRMWFVIPLMEPILLLAPMTSALLYGKKDKIASQLPVQIKFIVGRQKVDWQVTLKTSSIFVGLRTPDL